MFKELSHKTFAVGGSVRNELLGLEAKDFDFVIADTTEEEFLAVFPEAQKVGNSFPVYLIQCHEVALSRSEKSIGNSYQDFEFVSGVSIQDDLSRRDFTINSIAKNVVTGELIDPHNGQQDIIVRIIRTINNNAFSDDSLRIYRGLRFAAEFDFTIEENTKELMKNSKHMLKYIPMERVALELQKAYERSEKPSVFFRLLLEIEALQIHFKPLYLMSKIGAGGVKYGRSNEFTAFDHAMDSFDYAKANGFSFDEALASLLHDTGKGVSKKSDSFDNQKHIGHEIMSYAINKQFIKQHRFTSKANELIVMFAKNHMYFHTIEKVKSPVKLVRFYKRIKKYADTIVKIANSDHELNENQIKIMNDLKRTFKETEISVPANIMSRGKDAIVEYVDNQYAQTYKEITK